jgi:hypothetical protein
MHDLTVYFYCPHPRSSPDKGITPEFGWGRRQFFQPSPPVPLPYAGEGSNAFYLAAIPPPT